MSTDRIEIPEVLVEGRRLGRHVRHDPRSLRYPFRAPTIELVSRRWSTDQTPILDQGNLGSCTGNATVAALLCDNRNPYNMSLTSEQKSALNEELAIRLYSEATAIDTFPGVYLPDDTGSDGLSVAKAAQNFGYISGYSHAFSLQDVLGALTTAPVILGIMWYEGFDEPARDGKISKTGELRGGHEICLDEIDVANQTVWFRNSWSPYWGVRGRAYMTWDTLTELLHEQGDATVFTSLAAPAPTPIPVPDPIVTSDVDEELYAVTTEWVKHKKAYKPNEVLRQLLLRWRKSHG